MLPEHAKFLRERAAHTCLFHEDADTAISSWDDYIVGEYKENTHPVWVTDEMIREGRRDAFASVARCDACWKIFLTRYTAK